MTRVDRAATNALVAAYRETMDGSGERAGAEAREAVFFFFFKQKTAYEIYECDWSSYVCSSDCHILESHFTYYACDYRKRKTLNFTIMHKYRLFNQLTALFSSIRHFIWGAAFGYIFLWDFALVSFFENLHVAVTVA